MCSGVGLVDGESLFCQHSYLSTSFEFAWTVVRKGNAS